MTDRLAVYPDRRGLGNVRDIQGYIVDRLIQDKFDTVCSYAETPHLLDFFAERIKLCLISEIHPAVRGYRDALIIRVFDLAVFQTADTDHLRSEKTVRIEFPAALDRDRCSFRFCPVIEIHSTGDRIRKITAMPLVYC